MGLFSKKISPRSGETNEEAQHRYLLFQEAKIERRNERRKRDFLPRLLVKFGALLIFIALMDLIFFAGKLNYYFGDFRILGFGVILVLAPYFSPVIGFFITAYLILLFLMPLFNGNEINEPIVNGILAVISLFVLSGLSFKGKDDSLSKHFCKICKGMGKKPTYVEKVEYSDGAIQKLGKDYIRCRDCKGTGIKSEYQLGNYSPKSIKK